MDTDKQFVTIDTIAKKLLVCHRSIFRYIKEDPSFPRPYRISPRHILFKSEELDAWLEKFARMS